MFYAEFEFAGRFVRNEYETLCEAIKQAKYILTAWPITIQAVAVIGDRRDGYPVITTVTRT